MLKLPNNDFSYTVDVLLGKKRLQINRHQRPCSKKGEKNIYAYISILHVIILKQVSKNALVKCMAMGWATVYACTGCKNTTDK